MKHFLQRGSNSLQVLTIVLLPDIPLLTLLAENAALRKAKASKENIIPMLTIPRPGKGSAGNGFNLQAKMGLTNDDELYGALRVS
jgi:hypothetical protein